MAGEPELSFEDMKAEFLSMDQEIKEKVFLILKITIRKKHYHSKTDL